jgi:hypothetical protein
MKNESSKQVQKKALRKTDVSGSLSWIDKDQIAGKCLNNFLKDEPETSPLYDISSKLLRQLIIEGIDAGLNYR